MRNRRTQKSPPVKKDRPAPNGRDTRDQTTLLLDAEAARRDAERKYRDIFENAVEGIFQTSPDGRFITANPALARMLGFESSEELIRERTDIGRTHYVHPERRVEIKRLLDQHDTVRGFEFEAYRKDGTKIWMSENVRAVREASGKLLYYEGTVEDITERKRAEAALRKSEERYRDLIENSHELICTHDLDGLILSANPAASAAVGYDLDEDVGKKTVRDLLAPEVKDQFDEYMARLRKDGTTSGIMLVQTKSGERRVWEYYNSLRTEGVATPIVRGMARDITEQRRAEKALRESEQELRLFNLATNDMFWKWDFATDQVARSIGFERVFGYSEAEITPLIGWWEERLHPDDRERVLTEFRTALEAGDKTCAHEYLFRRHDGSYAAISDRAYIVRDQTGKGMRAMGAMTDISDRKRTEEALRESEERYRALFENAKDAMYVHDLNGNYTSVNPAAERLSGYSRDEIIGRNFAEFIAEENVEQARKNLWKKVKEKGGTTYETEIVNKSGKRVQLEVSSRMIYANGVAVGVQGSARDITETKRARQALLDYSRRLIEAQETERRRIARELHDQIGQMLTALKLNLHAIQSARDGNEAWRLIEDNLKMLDEALEQVRDLSVNLRPPLLDDLGLVTALRWYVDRHAQRTGVVAEFTSDSLDPDLRFSAELETACFRIAQEALTNVARHADAKLLTVRLSRDKQHLRLSIEDDGVGFDIESPRGHVVGATLGLRGMEERAKALGGRIRIESTRNNGTRVFVQLPIAIPSEAKPRAQTARE